MMEFGMMQGGWGGGTFGVLSSLMWLVWFIISVELAVFLWKKIK